MRALAISEIVVVDAVAEWTLSNLDHTPNIEPANKIFEKIRSAPGGREYMASKLHAICGDITLPSFGIKQSDLDLLSSRVSVVLNSAATIRFVEPLDEAVHKNIYSCEQLFELCDRLNNLQALIHLSTAYSNCHKRDTIFEIFYEPPMRGAEIIDCVEKLKTCQKRLHQYNYVDTPVGGYDRNTCEPQRFFDNDHYPIATKKDKTTESRGRRRASCPDEVAEDRVSSNSKTSSGEKDSVSTANECSELMSTASVESSSGNRSKSDCGNIDKMIGTSTCKLLDDFTQIALLQSNRPNTYTLTKAISESYILDLAKARSERYLEFGSKVKVSILRPSIVGAAWHEPYKGLIDNYNGPTGAILSLYTGVLQAMPGNGRCVADVVPCDVVVNCALAIGWFLVELQQKQEQDKRQQQNSSINRNSEASVWRDTANIKFTPLGCKHVQQDQGIYLFNMVSGYRNPFAWGLVTELIAEIGYKYPTKFLKRLPGSYFVPSGRLFNIYDKLMHYLPALLIDKFNFRVYGARRDETKALLVYNRIKQMTNTLAPFTSNQWRLCDINVRVLYDSLAATDKKLFNFDVTSIEWRQYIRNYILGSRVYLLRDDFGPSSVLVARRKLNK